MSSLAVYQVDVREILELFLCVEGTTQLSIQFIRYQDSKRPSQDGEKRVMCCHRVVRERQKGSKHREP